DNIARIDDGQSTSLLGQGNQALLREPELVQRSAERSVLELRIVGPRADVDQLAKLTQSARIDPVHVHVCTLGSSGCLLCLCDDCGSGLGQVERLVDVVVETFAEEQQRFASPLDVAKRCCSSAKASTTTSTS